MSDDRQIANPRVLFVEFENQGGDWVVKIPHAFGKDNHFVAPIEDNLTLQFQPTKMRNLLAARETIGVACIPLLREEAGEEEDNAKSKS